MSHLRQNNYEIYDVGEIVVIIAGRSWAFIDHSQTKVISKILVFMPSRYPMSRLQKNRDIRVLAHQKKTADCKAIRFAMDDFENIHFDQTALPKLWLDKKFQTLNTATQFHVDCFESKSSD